MTDAHPELDQLSALFDGEDHDGVAAHVSGCAQCAATLDGFHAVREAIATAPPFGAEPGEDVVEGAVGAALAAAAAPARSPGVTPTPTSGATITAMPVRPRRVPTWVIGLAAAILVIAAAVPLASRLISSGRTSVKSASPGKVNSTAGPAGASTPVVQDPAGAAADSSAASAAGNAAAGPAFASGALPDLGHVDDVTTLRGAVASAAQAFAAQPRSAEPTPGATQSPGGGAPRSPLPSFTCGPAAAAATGSPSESTLRFAGTVVWRGTPAFAFVLDRPDGSAVGVVAASTGCATLATFTP